MAHGRPLDAGAASPSNRPLSSTKPVVGASVPNRQCCRPDSEAEKGPGSKSRSWRTCRPQSSRPTASVTSVCGGTAKAVRGADSGIDTLAADKLTGQLWAAQCRFPDPPHTSTRSTSRVEVAEAIEHRCRPLDTGICAGQRPFAGDSQRHSPLARMREAIYASADLPNAPPQDTGRRTRATTLAWRPRRMLLWGFRSGLGGRQPDLWIWECLWCIVWRAASPQTPVTSALPRATPEPRWPVSTPSRTTESSFHHRSAAAPSAGPSHRFRPPLGPVPDQVRALRPGRAPSPASRPSGHRPAGEDQKTRHTSGSGPGGWRPAQ